MFMTKTTVEMIREIYPNPIKYQDYLSFGYPDGGYCVGGALGKYSGRYENNDAAFPTHFILAQIIQGVNPQISEEIALSCAMRIVMQNDKGRFRVAWDYLKKALTY